MRMSRIGSYLYARERKTWTGNPEKVDGSLSTPSWQSFPMFREAHIANQTGNLLLAQIGALGIYTVFFVVPLAAFSYLVNNKWWICWPVIAGLSFIAVNVILKGRNQVFTNERYIFSDQKPMSYPSRGGPLQAIFGKLDSTGRLRNSYSADEHGLTTMDGKLLTRLRMKMATNDHIAR